MRRQTAGQHREHARGNGPIAVNDVEWSRAFQLADEAPDLR